MVAVDNVRKKSMLAPPGLLPVPEETKRKSSFMEYARRMSSRPVRSSEESVQGSTRLGSSSSILGVGSATSGSSFLVEPSTNLGAGSTLQRRTSHHIQRYP